MITCDITIKNEKGEITEDKIFEDVFSNCNKKIDYIDLNLIREEITDEDGTTRVYNKLNASVEEIEDFEFETGIYFIISSDKRKLLYIGKALNVKNRLKAHLIKKAESVSSELFKINAYLRKTNTKSVFYYALQTDKNSNASVEGALIDFAKRKREEKIERYLDLFNERKD